MWFSIGMLLASLSLGWPLLGRAQSVNPGDPPAGARAAAPSITFAWDYPASGTAANGFQFLRCQAASVTTDCASGSGLGGMMPLTQRQATDTSAEEGKRYCWWVRAVRTVGEPGPGSNSVCVTMTSGTTPPPLAAPTNFRRLP